MASGTSSLESNGSNESMSHSYVSNERHKPGQIPTIPIPIEYDVLTSSHGYEKQTYAVGRVMSGAYDSLGQYEVVNKQTNESLKQQCEKALHELSQLRRQHTETSRRCEHVMKELEYFRGQHRAAMNQLEVSAQEASSLRGKYGDLLNDNQRLEREVQHLQQTSSAEGGSDSWVHTLRKYEVLKEEFDCLQKRYEDLIEENNRFKTQCHELTKERTNIVHERNSLKQQVTKQRADIKRLTDERNATLTEYTLVMSERDTVHKEMEKLSDDLQAALKRVAALESALQASREEQRATALQAESLRREVEAALLDRDRALKECSDLKAPQSSVTIAKARQDNSAYHHLGLASGVGNDGFLNGQHSNDPSLELAAMEKARADELEQPSAELERVRKQLVRLQAELADAQSEAEVSKRRRDWAFSERDKLLQERESVKALCSKLRKERDQMVGQLAEARRQKKGVDTKDPKNVRAILVSEHADPDSRGTSQSTISSADSAICTDVTQDFEWDIIEVELNGLSKDGDLGFELSGGREDPFFPNDYSVYVTAVQKGSVAEGKIKVLDRVTDACGACAWASGGAAAAALRSALARGPAALRLARPRARRVTLHLPDARGVVLHHGMFINKIASGSVASKLDNIYIGDRVASINNRSLEGVKSVSEAMSLLNECQYDAVTLTVLRPLYPCCHDTSDRSRSSLYDHSYAESKMVNICSQTEESWRQYPSPPPDHKVHIEHGVSDFDGKYVYHVAAGSQGKIHQERGTWDMIRGKIEAVTGRSKSKDKQIKVPESDAIAELDSVLDYHGKSIKETSGVLKRSRRKNKESQSISKNGGTWPKARANFVLEENPTGTIVQPRSRKDRPPLSTLFSPPTKLQPEPQRSNINRNSNPVPLGHAPLTQMTTPARHSVYKSIESSPANAHFPKPAPLSIHKPFTSPNSINFEKLRNHVEHDMTPNRLSLALNPSDDSLDYQPVSRSRTKSPQSLDFMVNKGPSSLDFVPRKSPSSHEHSIRNHPGRDILEQYYSKKSSLPKTVNKYPSDSDSFGPDSLNGNINFGMTGTLPSQSRAQYQYYRAPFLGSNPPTTHRYPHLASPTNIPQSQSGESIGMTYDMLSFMSHSHNMSELQAPRTNRADYPHAYEGGTFPRKKENPRFRIPSNPSVTSKNSAGKLSTGSIERSLERNSPMPPFQVEVLSPGRGARPLANRLALTTRSEGGVAAPLPGELRRVHIEKSQRQLGINIYCPPGGGVFVSTVNENSLASKVGLQVGDQLLEVCGINMRSATFEVAARVLRQIGNSITMLVHYSPEKYRDEVDESGGSSSEASSREAASLSGSPTPRNSPGPQRGATGTVSGQGPGVGTGAGAAARFLLVETRACSDLRISLVGGNAVGIFVHSVQPDSPAYDAGLRTGDQILEYNNVDLRHATAEQAALELAKPTEKHQVSMLVRYDSQQYNEIKDKPGDAFYIRPGFDRCPKFVFGTSDSIDEYRLFFRKDEVLFVDNTLYNGAPGLWRAWRLDSKGNKQQWGTIPSKFKVEEILRRSMGAVDSEAQRRASTTARRSFFRRKKHRDSKELASFSNTELGCWSDSGTLADDVPLLSYQRVEMLHYGSQRPVVVLGPLWECVAVKLVSDWPGVFAQVRPDPLPVSGTALQKALDRGTYLEPRLRRDSTHLDCIPLQAIKDLAEKGMHCILDISVATIEKLHKHQVYPIVLLLKFKSFKQIKEMKDTRYPPDKVSVKAAKEMYQHGQKVESEYRNYISAEIPAGVNIAHMCTQIKEAVEKEQNKILWVPSVQA